MLENWKGSFPALWGSLWWRHIHLLDQLESLIQEAQTLKNQLGPPTEEVQTLS